jgi:hypothetical protein
MSSAHQKLNGPENSLPLLENHANKKVLTHETSISGGKKVSLSGEPSVRRAPAHVTVPCYPEQWRPRAIHPTAFFKGHSYIYTHSVDHAAQSLPSLLLNWDMFKAMWKTAWRVREVHVTSQRLAQHRVKHAALIQQLDRDNSRHNAEIRRIGRPYWTPSLPYPAEVNMQMQNLYERIDANHARRAELEAELGKAEQAYESLFEKYEQAQEVLNMFLDSVFGGMGILPSPDNFDKPVLVPVMDRDQDEDQTQLWDWPENTWNDNHDWISLRRRSYDPEAPWNNSRPRRSSYHDDPEAIWNNSWKDYPQEYDVNWLRAELEEKRQRALNVTTHFENFRETYHTQLERYIIENRREHTDPSVIYPDSNDLEDQFGPVWLSKCQSITREVMRTEEDFYTTEKKLNDVKRADKLLASHDEDGLTHQNLRLGNTQSVADVHNFGELVPSRKRKHIDDWLEAGSMQSKQRKVQVTDDTVSMFNLSERSDQISLVEYAEGYQRRKIDNYICQSRQAWPHDGVPAAKSELPKEILHELELDAASVD